MMSIVVTYICNLAYCSSALCQQPGAAPGSEPLRQLRADYVAGTSRRLRIINGHDTSIEKHPWQVAILDTVTFGKSHSNVASQFCGGSLIATKWVLTAAHCVDNGTKPTDLFVLSGTATLLTGGKRAQIVPDGIILHKDWSRLTHENDIALLHLQDDAIGTPIAGWSPSEDDAMADRSVVITGWGATSWIKPPLKTSLLQEILLPVVAHERCNQPVSYGNGRVTEKMLCIGDFDHGGSDSCQGDSGGPATSTLDSGIRLIGIVSWGDPDRCGTAQMPGVYTRVSQYNDWVSAHTSKEVKWPAN